MSEMVDRVAASLYTTSVEAAGRQAIARPWNELDLVIQSPWFYAARAAIAAMREPTDKMTSCEMHLGGFGYGNDVYQADPKEVWQAMIDEALR